MKANRVQKVLVPTQFVLLSYQGFSGVFHELLPREVFETSHFINGLLLATLLLTHLALNWGWVRGNLFGTRTGAGPNPVEHG